MTKPEHRCDGCDRLQRRVEAVLENQLELARLYRGLCESLLGVQPPSDSTPRPEPEEDQWAEYIYDIGRID
jgi:hypothetical protein